MQWLTECILFHGADNSRQKEQHMKKRGSPMFSFLRVKFIEFLSHKMINHKYIYMYDNF